MARARQVAAAHGGDLGGALPQHLPRPHILRKRIPHTLMLLTRPHGYNTLSIISQCVPLLLNNEVAPRAGTAATCK